MNLKTFCMSPFFEKKVMHLQTCLRMNCVSQGYHSCHMSVLTMFTIEILSYVLVLQMYIPTYIRTLKYVHT